MQKWEHEFSTILPGSGALNLTDEQLHKLVQIELTTRGAQGWELVSTVLNQNTLILFFKRPMP